MKKLTVEEESRLWDELIEIIISRSKDEIFDWMRSNGLYEEYERMKQNEQSKSDIISETKIIL